MSRRMSFYIYGLAGLAVPLLYGYGRSLDQAQWPLLLTLSAARVVFVLFSIQAPTGQSMTLSSAVQTIAILMGGTPLGVWVAAMGEVVSAVLLGSELRRTLFNTAQFVISVAVAGSTFAALGGQPGWGEIQLLYAVPALLAYLVVNHVLVGVLMALVHGQSLLKTLLAMVRDGVESYLIIQAVGLVATFVVVQGGTAWTLVLLGLLVLVHRVLSQYYGALRRDVESTRRQAVQESLLGAMVAALDARDVYTSGHSGRVAHYADAIAQAMGLDQGQRDLLKYASLLHDIGKIGIPDSILRKDGPLTPTERALMMEHPVRGIQILSQAPNVPEVVLQAVHHHHEWVNGGGYPDGIRGDEIPLLARIISVADALDAMTSARPYRDGLPWSEGLARLVEGSGTQFDPQVVAAMLRVAEQQPGLLQEMVARNRPVLSELENQLERERRQAGNEAGRILPVHSREIKILYELAMARRTLHDLDETLHQLLAVLHGAVGDHLYYIMLYDEAAGDLAVRAAAGSGQVVGQRWSVTETVGDADLAGGQPVIIPDVGHYPHLKRADPRTRSLVTVPLLSEGRVMGVLRGESRCPGAFDQDEGYLLIAVARQFADTMAVARAHEQLSHAASHDGLTGALNRTAFYQRLARELDQAAREGYPLSVAVLDLNHFKEINDTYGHVVGDQTIRQFSLLLRQNVGATDAVARYGGDEFAVILPRTGRQEAVARIARIAELGYTVTVGTCTIPGATVSWGLASFPEQHGTAEELVIAADQNMYRQKHEARAGVAV